MPDTPEDVVKEARELLAKATPRWEQSQLAPAYVISLAGDDHEVIASFGEYKENGELDHEFKNAVNNMALAIRAPELLASLCNEVDPLRKIVVAAADLGCLRGRQVHCAERETNSNDWCAACQAKYLLRKP